MITQVKMTDWFSKLQNSKKSCIVDGTLKKVHYDFGDGRELVEEFDLNTHCVTRRAWRCNKELKGETSWEIEVGDPEPNYSVEEKCMIREDAGQVQSTKPCNFCCLIFKFFSLLSVGESPK